MDIHVFRLHHRQKPSGKAPPRGLPSRHRPGLGDLDPFGGRARARGVRATGDAPHGARKPEVERGGSPVRVVVSGFPRWCGSSPIWE